MHDGGTNEILLYSRDATTVHWLAKPEYACSFIATNYNYPTLTDAKWICYKIQKLNNVIIYRNKLHGLTASPNSCDTFQKLNH